MWNKLWISLIVLLLASCAAGKGQKELESIEILIKGHSFSVEMARTDEEKRVGLMFRESMTPDHGMLFIYNKYVKGAFWMKNTILPLSIAFIADDGKIVDIKDMQPLSQKSIAPRFSYMYALEVNQGIFGQKGIKVGDYVEFPMGFK